MHGENRFYFTDRKIIVPEWLWIHSKFYFQYEHKNKIIIHYLTTSENEKYKDINYYIGKAFNGSNKEQYIINRAVDITNLSKKHYRIKSVEEGLNFSEDEKKEFLIILLLILKY